MAPLALLAACTGGSTEPPPALPALAGISTILRLPAECGRLIAFRPDSLLPWGWTSGPGVPGLERSLGYDLDERIVWAVDQQGRLVGIDLESGGWRAYSSGVRRASVGPEGSVYVVDSAGRLVRFNRRTPATLPASFRKPPTALWGAINGQALAVSADSSPGLRLISLEHSGPPAPVGDGAVAPTFWGELVAIADGDKIRLVRSNDGATVRTIALTGKPSAVLFSPSGHRIYALVRDKVLVADRFSGVRLASIELPAETRGARIDPSGRWMLVRPPKGDSAWIVDLATARHVATVDTEWRDDLPLVAGAATLMVKDGRAVDAYNLAAVPPARMTTIPGGGTDFWLVIPWVPPQRAPKALRAAETAVVQQDKALVNDSIVTEESAVDEIWLQVSSSQNPDWAEELADQLREAGHRATVWPPDTPEESYRVVVGPYSTREQADEAGRRLGRPYFTVNRKAREP